MNLFKGYAACSDEKFREYIEKKQVDYEDGFDMTPEILMTYAENKYNTMIRDIVWNALSPDQERIVALSSTVQELKDINLKLAKAFSGKSRNATFNDRKGKDTDFWAWKKIPPNDKDPKTKKKNNKTYHWCFNYQMRTLHTLAECKRRIPEGEKTIHDTLIQLKGTDHNTMMKDVLDDIEEEEEDQYEE